MKTPIPFLVSLTLVSTSARPPNIVFILADDLGITDINAYASHFTDAKPEDLFYETPHLDRLVADGIAFSTPISPPPVRLNGSFRGLPQKAKS